jgi:flagellar hook-length control protein FliK
MIPILLPDASKVTTTAPAQGGTAPIPDAALSFAALVEEKIIVAEENVENLDEQPVEADEHILDDTPRDSLEIEGFVELPPAPLHQMAHPVFVQNAPPSNAKGRAIVPPPVTAEQKEQVVTGSRNQARENSELQTGHTLETKEQGIRVFAPARGVGLLHGTQQGDKGVKGDEALPIIRMPTKGSMEFISPPRQQELEVDHKPILRSAVTLKGLASSAAITIPIGVQPAAVPSEEIEIEPAAAALSERNTAGPLTSSRSSLSQIETVRHVATQLAGAVADRTGRPTEISLNPEELGRVRLTISAADTAINLSISAERQETTDLLRRHIDALAQEFKELGYDDISFSFAEREGSQETDVDHTMSVSDLSVDDEDDFPRSPTMMASASSLDIKL